MSKVGLIMRKKMIGRSSIEGLFQIFEKVDGIRKIELPYELNSLKNAFKLALFSLKIREKKIHITGDVHYMAMLLFWKKIIITIHDCNHYESLTGLRKFMVGILWFKLPILISRRIVVISPFVKDQVQRNFKINSDKIEIIPNGFNPIKSIRKEKLNNNFNILIIGTKLNKNLCRLFEAVKFNNNIQLIIVGNLTSKQNKMLDEYKISYLNDFNISQAQLENYYNSAEMLYFASTKEGFGLPILEAQSCGLPVLTSNTTSMPYVAGAGALIINPYDVEEIRIAIQDLFKNPLLREELIAKGLENIKRFTNEKFVLSYQKLYENL
tara:strand:+ start:6310 stop:7281 length:972 start_codon:yes stop_codon:yes gene_type:complete